MAESGFPVKGRGSAKIAGQLEVITGGPGVSTLPVRQLGCGEFGGGFRLTGGHVV